MLERLNEKRNDEGFTLIELLIVIIILAILAAIVVFAVGTTTTNAKASSCNADAKSVETAVEAYKAQQGAYPPSMAALTTAGPNGPWLREAPSATLATNGYVVTLVPSTGEVDVQNNTAGPTNYDVTNLCNSIT
jgi:prepilin-type N-terminal cleavage/methylation domain-containing protein